MLHNIYTFFLGIILAIFVGVGIAVFYPAPQMPTDNLNIEYNDKGTPATEEDKKKEANQNTAWEEHSKKSQAYSRNVSLIAMAIAVVLASVGLLFEKRVSLLANGVLLGGLFLLLYSLGHSFASANTKFSFAVTGVCLLVTIAIGYRKFGPHAPAAVKKK